MRREDEKYNIYRNAGQRKEHTWCSSCKKLGYSFIDSDLVIQEKYGTTLERIIEKYGDDGFIKIENDVNCTINAEHAVIATGGSAVYGETAMEHFKDIGTVIYLEVDEIELEERVGSLKERGVVSNGKTTIDEIFEDRKICIVNMPILHLILMEKA